MNERIKELALQADAIKCHGYIPHPELDGHLIWAADAAIDTTKMDAKKFAELIVRECVDTAFRKGHPDLEFLLKHFGVEE